MAVTVSPQGLASIITKPIHFFAQCFPPRATYTEKDYPDLTGKICIITGSNSGIGKEAARLLYSKNATVYILARTEQKAHDAIEWIKQQHPESKGKLGFLKLDLSDLATIKPTVQQFLDREAKLHILINNAGVLNCPRDKRTPQGHQMEMGTNCLGHLLLTKLLTPTLAATAREDGEHVRVVWTSSFGVDVAAPHGGMDLEEVKARKGSWFGFSRYAVSKTGNYFHALEYAKEHRRDGIISMPVHPGNLRSDLSRDTSFLFRTVAYAVTYPAVYGAYAELFAALSPEVTIERSGDWIEPWGRLGTIARADVIRGAKPEEEGGDGTARKFWEWSEDQVKDYM